MSMDEENSPTCFDMYHSLTYSIIVIMMIRYRSFFFYYYFFLFSFFFCTVLSQTEAIGRNSDENYSADGFSAAVSSSVTREPGGGGEKGKGTNREDRFRFKKAIVNREYDDYRNIRIRRKPPRRWISLPWTRNPSIFSPELTSRNTISHSTRATDWRRLNILGCRSAT